MSSKVITIIAHYRNGRSRPVLLSTFSTTSWYSVPTRCGLDNSRPIKFVASKELESNRDLYEFMLQRVSGDLQAITGKGIVYE